MTKFEIAAALLEISSLLRLKEKEPFRAKAYARAAEAVAEAGANFPELVKQNRLTEIKGIGTSLAGVIRELHTTGRAALLENLRAEFPQGAVALSKIGGLTKEKIRTLNTALGISTLDDLKAALEAGKIRELAGFGIKSEAALREQIAKFEQPSEGILLINALRVGERLLEFMRTLKGIERVELAGSARRWNETVSTIRVTALAARNHAAVVNHFLGFPTIIEVEQKTPDFAAVKLNEGVRATISVASAAEYWNLLHHETGSTSYETALGRIAGTKGLKLTPRKLLPVGKRKSLKVESEADIYRHLDMQFIPPELRDDDSQIKAALAGEIPKDLIKAEHIKGMVHCHTTYSDGRNSVEEMALAAQSMGIEYMTITDHSPTAFYAGGLKVDRLKKQWEEIDRVQERVSIKLLRGTESDILRDGELDYPDSILEKFDVIIASIHNRYKLDEAAMTKRIINAMKNPLFKIWGHPLGRLVLRRPPISCRLEEILDVIAKSRAIIEISGDPHRLDLEPRWIKEARKRRIKFVISTDAHSISDLRNLKFGIGMARRAGTTSREVLNTRGVGAFRKAVKP
jgi:DNA polymerase (family 10)